jgi:dTDP-4-amino-4,6-dideoxygalactose transaminase
MEAVMRVARKHKMLVVEDACQAAGGGYRRRMLGSIGAAGAFSFNFFKNMTCGEGGAVVSRDERVARRASCAIDCCAFYWSGRGADVRPFASNGSRASEIEGAMLNAQLDRIGQLLRRARRRKKQILRAAAKHTSLSASPCHSIDDECGTHVLFNFPTAQQAEEFAERASGTVCGKTGRHTYNEWDPILAKRGGHHPAMNPFEFPANRKCRMNYSTTMLPRTLDLVNRTVMIATHPEHSDAEGEARIPRIIAAAKVIEAGLPDGVGRVAEAARSSSRHTRAGQRDAAVRGPAHPPRRGER